MSRIVGGMTNPIIIMTAQEFADDRGVDYRTVKRWLGKNRIVGATQGPDGRWSIPADAPLRPAAPVERVSTSTDVATTRGHVPDMSPFGDLYTLEEVAARLDTTVGRIHEMGADGVLIVRKYGRGGAWRVYVPPTGGAR